MGGFLGNALGFEAFHAKDLWDRLKKDPKRLVLGVDPLSTKAWNAVLGRKDEPLVDQLGGAYGGHTISAFGNNDGGVYARAKAAGIDTSAGEKMQDAAHVVAALFGGQGLSNAGSNILGSVGQGGGQNLGVFSNNGVNGLQGVGSGNAGQLAASHGIAGGAGIGNAGTAAGPGSLGLTNNWQNYAKAGQQLGGNPQQQQQQQSGPKPYWYRGQVIWM